MASGPIEISSLSAIVSDTNSVIKCGSMEVEPGVQIYPGGCLGTDVHPFSVRFKQVVQEHGRTSGRCRCGSFGDECQILSLPVPLPFSPPPHLNNRPLIDPPIPYSALYHSLPSLHPASCPLDTPAAECPHAHLPRLPLSPLAVFTWCLNSSSLNSATSTLNTR